MRRSAAENACARPLVALLAENYRTPWNYLFTFPPSVLMTMPRVESLACMPSGV